MVEGRLTPGSVEWRGRVTASKVGAILGISPFKSQYAMWHEMAGLVEPDSIDSNDAKFGHFAELMLGPWWESEEDGRNLGEHEPSFENERGWVATPDYVAEDSDGTACVVECKTTKDFDDWADGDGNPAVPSHYYAQVLFQMALAKVGHAYVVVLGPFKQIEIHRIEFDPELWTGIEQRLVDWETSLEKGVAPDLDTEPSTLATVRKLHRDITRNKEIEVDPALAAKFVDAKTNLDEAQKRYNAYEIVGRDLMEDAHRMMCDGVKIADRRGNSHGSTSFVVNKKAVVPE